MEKKKSENLGEKLPALIFIGLILGFLLVGLLSIFLNNPEETYALFFWLIVFVGVPAIVIMLTKHIKNIVICTGRKLLDFTTSFDVVISVAILIAGFFICKNEYGLTVNLWWYVLGSIAYLLIMLLKDYVLYLLIDIRDSLKKITDKEK